MNTRRFGKTGWIVGEVGLGTWQIGADWGSVSEEDAQATLGAALDSGVNLFDTADVYGDGLSERRIAAFRKQRSEPFHVITKTGRRCTPHTSTEYNEANLNAFVDRSRQNLNLDTLELVQLHCPPTDVFEGTDQFEIMDAMVAAGKIQHWGVSVEKISEAQLALRWPTLSSIQIIFNMFRQRPATELLAEAAEKDVAVIVRVPLASGLLTGKITANSVFGSDDHRNYNRKGEAFDVGETFSGVPFGAGLEAVEELRALVPEDTAMAQWALRWILMHEHVSVAIPGARNVEQAQGNAAASDVAGLNEATMEAVREVYDRLIAPHVKNRW